MCCSTTCYVLYAAHQLPLHATVIICAHCTTREQGAADAAAASLGSNAVRKNLFPPEEAQHDATAAALEDEGAYVAELEFLEELELGAEGRFGGEGGAVSDMEQRQQVCACVSACGCV